MSKIDWGQVNTEARPCRIIPKQPPLKLKSPKMHLAANKGRAAAPIPFQKKTHTQLNNCLLSELS